MCNIPTTENVTFGVFVDDTDIPKKKRKATIKEATNILKHQFNILKNGRIYETLGQINLICL